MIAAAVALAALVVTASSPRPESGELLYRLHCSSCHGSSGQGSTIAPALVGKPAADVHFMMDTGRMPASIPNEEEEHRAPAFTEQQIDDIVDYVMTFTPHPDRSLPVVVMGDLQHGHALFAENCAHCHGAGGSGASVGFDNIAPPLNHASVFQVAEAIRAGPGVMPRFGTDVLTDRDVDDIATYVNYLQTTSDEPAGLKFGNIGPVAEGFIGWLGLGLLVLFVRKIGTTD